MNSLKDLREKVAHLANNAKALLAEKGSTTWTVEEQAKYDGFTNEMTLLQGQIKAHEAQRELDADKFFNAAGNKPAGAGADDGEITIREAVALYLRNGKNLSAEQAIAVSNAMSTTTPSEGGYTVPSEVATMVIDALKAYGGMRLVADVITTESGAPLNYPTSDGTSEYGEIVAQNQAASIGNATFNTMPINPFKYSSKVIALPIELIQDSAIDVVAFVVKRLATRLARITNQHYTIGTGSGQPTGVYQAAAVGVVGATGQTLSITYDNLIDLIASVNSAYRTNAQFMLSDKSVAVIRKLKDTLGRPIWTPGDGEGIADGVPSTICGYAYTINDDAPQMAASAKSIAFGNFDYYMIRDIKDSTRMLRFDDSAFALNGQVGFCGWMRSGGNLMDLGAIKTYQNSAT